MTLDDLSRLYAKFNKLYFANKLPECVVRWGDIDWYGSLLDKEDAAPLEYCIEIARWSQKWPEVATMTLLHEMAHMKLRKRTYGHGILFQKEMQRLAKLGAFNGLW